MDDSAQPRYIHGSQFRLTEHYKTQHSSRFPGKKLGQEAEFHSLQGSHPANFGNGQMEDPTPSMPLLRHFLPGLSIHQKAPESKGFLSQCLSRLDTRVER